jgi:hypothetical protein
MDVNDVGFDSVAMPSKLYYAKQARHRDSQRPDADKFDKV